jgi:hypothetical protein
MTSRGGTVRHHGGARLATLVALILAACSASPSRELRDAMGRGSWADHFRYQNVELNRTAISEVATRFGATVDTGSESNAAYVCIAAGAHAFIVFLAGPLGSWKRVTSLLLTRDAPMGRGCSTMPTPPPPRTGGGLQLGMTRGSVVERLGEPRGGTNDAWKYDRVRPSLENPGFEVNEMISVTFRDDGVDSVEVSRTESK